MECNDFIRVLKSTAVSLMKAYSDNCEPKSGEIAVFDSSYLLVFPKKRDGTLRISEQELRFEFIHQLLIDKKKWWYSIETPTMGAYKGFAAGDPECTAEPGKESSIGQSGKVDTVIFDKTGKRTALIEFKANNPKKEDYWKDFVKMNHEGVPNNYFVQLLESADRATFKNIEGKLDGGKETKNDRKINNAKFYCIVLKKGGPNHKDLGIYSYDGKCLESAN